MALSTDTNMSNNLNPKIYIKKNKIPVIYLDTCLLIELSRYEKGKCTDVHSQHIGKLYDILLSLMRENRILCPLGNQMCEMGMSRQRQQARNFVFQFTNARMIEPSGIEDMQFDIGCNAFVNSESSLNFNAEDIFERLYSDDVNSFKIDIATIYPEEKILNLKQSKYVLMQKLNTAKKSNEKVLDFYSQLKLELEADFQVFMHIIENYDKSIESYSLNIDTLVKIFRRIGINIIGTSNEERVNAVSIHNDFLLSLYHHQLPCVWIKSVLFAHIMQRPNKIIQSDYLDIMWASAYLPFIDYAITDKKFCALLNQSGLAELYRTKVYDLNSIDKLLEELIAL